MLAYALQEQRQAGNTYTAALLRKIPKLLDEIETLKTRRRRREPLIASDEFPDEAKIIGGQMLERHCGLTAGLTRGGTSSASLGRPCSLA